MFIQVFLLLLGFLVLIKGADWLVNGSVSLAKRFNVSELVIGLTIVAFGTSTPELVVNIISSLQDYNDVTLGNVVGSNLFNILLILGISGIIIPLKVQIKTVWNEISFSLIAAVILLILANLSIIHPMQKSISRLEGALLLLLFLAFMVYVFKSMKSSSEMFKTNYRVYSTALSFGLILFGLLSLIIGSRLVVSNAVKIAEVAGASEKLIGITIVSAGTSLPEMVTSIVAASKKTATSP